MHLGQSWCDRYNIPEQIEWTATPVAQSILSSVHSRPSMGTDGCRMGQHRHSARERSSRHCSPTCSGNPHCRRRQVRLARSRPCRTPQLGPTRQHCLELKPYCFELLMELGAMSLGFLLYSSPSRSAREGHLTHLEY